MKKLILAYFVLISCISFGGFEPYQKEIGILQDYLIKKKFDQVDSMAAIIFNKMPQDSLSLKASLFFAIAGDCSSRGFDEQVEKYLKQCIVFHNENNIELKLIDAHLELGVFYYHKERMVEALDQFKSSLELSVKLEDRFGMALSYNNIGLVFMYSASYKEAQNYFSKTLEYMSDDQYYLKGALYTNLGVINYYLEEYEKSLEHLEQAENTIINNPEYVDSFSLANVQLNKALNYYEFKQYEKAVDDLEEARSIYFQEKQEERLLIAKVNLMLNYYFVQNEKWKELEIKLKEDVLAGQSSDLKYDYFNYLSIIYEDAKDYQKAFEYLNKANEWIQIRAKEKTDQAIQSLQGDVKFKTLNNEIEELSGEQKALIDENKEKKEENEELQNLNRWILILSIASILFLLGLIYIFYRSSKVQRKLNEKLEKQNTLIQEKHEELINSSDYAINMEKMLLQQMNPHFIFNALMTIDASLSMKEYAFAQEYIEQFTQLTRKTLDNSRAEVIPLQDEIDYLKTYISLYQTKLGKVFEFKFSYNEELVEDFVYTPPMLIQPFIENAILHGLMNKKKGPKTLEIEVEPLEDTILWKIKDNGVGRKASAKQNAKKNVSHGSKITEDRIKWMENIYGSNFSIKYVDLDQGTLVEIVTPIIEI